MKRRHKPQAGLPKSMGSGYLWDEAEAGEHGERELEIGKAEGIIGLHRHNKI